MARWEFGGKDMPAIASGWRGRDVAVVKGRMRRERNVGIWKAITARISVTSTVSDGSSSLCEATSVIEGDFDRRLYSTFGWEATLLRAGVLEKSQEGGRGQWSTSWATSSQFQAPRLLNGSLYQPSTRWYVMCLHSESVID